MLRVEPCASSFTPFISRPSRPTRRAPARSSVGSPGAATRCRSSPPPAPTIPPPAGVRGRRARKADCGCCAARSWRRRRRKASTGRCGTSRTPWRARPCCCARPPRSAPISSPRWRRRPPRPRPRSVPRALPAPRHGFISMRTPGNSASRRRSTASRWAPSAPDRAWRHWGSISRRDWRSCPGSTRSHRPATTRHAGCARRWVSRPMPSWRSRSVLARICVTPMR